MDKMKNLKDLLEEQLQDLYSAEKQIIDALPKMIEKADNNELSEALSKHLEETKEQKQRLEKACEKLGTSPEGETCKAIKGIIKEAEDFMQEDADTDVMDAGIIANGQRVEHYEIAGYGTAVRYAKQVGEKEVAELLEKTLEEEKHADQKLNEVAEEVNKHALT